MSLPPERAAGLKTCLDANGSDKAQGNQYHKFYASVLHDSRRPTGSPALAGTQWLRLCAIGKVRFELHLRGTGMASEHLLECSHLDQCSLARRKADGERAVRLGVGEVRYDEIIRVNYQTP